MTRRCQSAKRHFSRGSVTGYDIWTLPLGGGGDATPLLQSSFNETQGQFSPDGPWIAYTSDETGSPEVYVQSFPVAGAKSVVTPAAPIRNGAAMAWNCSILRPTAR